MNPFATMLRITAALLALSLLAAACGSGSDSTVVAGDGSAGDGPADSPVPDEPADDGVVDSSDSDGPDEDPPPDEILGAGPYPIAELNIEYNNGTDTISYGITCLGDTATLIGDVAGVSDQRACLALADEAVQARLTDGLSENIACTQIYGGPDVAVITGRINDEPVDTSVDMANGCGIGDWTELLVDILPRPSNSID